MCPCPARSIRRFSIPVLLIVLSIVAPPQALCLNPALSLTQYVHSKWGSHNGLDLVNVVALAQTGDGYLWLATGSGLARFDGVRFVVPPLKNLPPGDIRALQVSNAGALWVATPGGIAEVSRGDVHLYASGSELPAGAITTILGRRDGGLWVGGAVDKAVGLWEVLNGRIKHYTSAEGLPGSGILSMLEDRRDGLWLGTTKGLCHWKPGMEATCFESLPLEAVSLQQDTDHSLWIADSLGKRILRFEDGRFTRVASNIGAASLTARVILRDRDGNLWIGTLGQGLLRMRPNGTLDRFTRRDGLSSDVVESLIEDREGNLWIGTASGLDRLGEPKATRISSLEGLSGDLITAVYASHDGPVWVGTAGGGLNRVNGSRIEHYLLDSGLPSTTVLSLFEDSQGTLWVGTTGGLVRRAQGRFVPVRLSDGTSLDRVFGIAGYPGGSHWFVDAARGLFTFRNGIAVPSNIQGLRDGRRISQIHYDGSGTLWIGYHDGGLARVLEGAVQSSPAFPSSGNPIQAIFDGSDGSLWVGTTAGLSRFENKSWTTWTAREGLPDGGVRDILEDGQQGLWLLSARRLVRASFRDLKVRSAGSSGPLPLSVLGPEDGIRISKRGILDNPLITKARDGTLWFATEEGVGIIDPVRLNSRAGTPNVLVERVTVEGRPIDVDSNHSLTFRGRECRFEYTALGLTTPESIQFRYKLESVESEWNDAGTRRTVVYTNLHPGKFRFRVMATNEDGQWNGAGATLDFEIAAKFYQTSWFVYLCVATAIAIGAAAYQWRGRTLRARFELVMQERLRLTRELHDTLLQGFAGVVYQLNAAVRQFETAPDICRQKLERALRQADQSLREARHTITFMRGPSTGESSLSEMLADVARQAVDGTAIALEFRNSGEPYELSYEAQWNIYALVREALHNACKHALPRSIALHVKWNPDYCEFRIQDDGIGFALPAATGKKGHWGLNGMHERARHIGAALTITTLPGQGTTIVVALKRRQRVAS